MPGNPTISLFVKVGPSNGSDGYTNTIASNGATYSYMYTGGDNNGGNVTCNRAQGPVTIVVQLQGDRRFSIDAITFVNDSNNQLTVSSSSPVTSVIHNKNTATQTADYKVTVNDSSAQCTVPCDPQIINK